ncbi:restriction endonuclease subunit S [Faecalibacterium prausnitzii]|uniref:restriction endonuclease subunit S n=1 Tax=Faecalibacterium prausnitzii TaxID=853 RepID=UPI001EDE980C|nr:restriction endonuclease subunit S [Faecalibacterium prausnitzii]MCG4801576.1 restriction endonuclease subunit S [Faecalibacterium prausnitzii]MDE8723634.1 restriction endonuclease subunit S [Faecalibacterium prausnitzii]
MAKLGDICFQITDGSHNPPAGIENSKHLMLSSKNINDDEITTTAPRFLTDEQFDIENKRTNVLSGDLLMTIVGTVGRVAVVPEMLAGICLQRSVAVIKPNPTIINNRYLMYQLQSMRKFLESEARGVAQKGIYLKQVGDLSVITPPLDEQYRVVDTLDHISGLIHIYQRQLTKLDELIKARFVEMFGDPVNNPLHWKKVKLSELADIKIGPFGSLLHKEDYVTGGHPLVNPSHIIDGKIIVDNDLTLTDEKYSELISYHLKKDDIVLGRRGEMGRCAVVDREGLLCGTGSLLLRPTGVVTADYIQKIISFPTFKKTIEAMAVGQTMPNLNVPIVSNFMIILPPLSVQKEYYDFVAEVDKSKLFAELFAQSTCILAENHSK